MTGMRSIEWQGKLGTSPLVWPTPRASAGLEGQVDEHDFAELLTGTGALLGVISDLDHSGVQALIRSWRDIPVKGEIKLIVTVYPACPTGEDDLESLRGYASSSEHAIELRLLAEDDFRPRPTCLLPINLEDGAPTGLLIAGTPNLGWTSPKPDDLNLYLTPDSALIAAWRRWFDYAFERAIPLTEESARIPALVPATGSPEAAELWRAYRQSCISAANSEPPVDRDTGEVAPRDASGAPKSTASVAVGLPPIDMLAERVTRIVSAGRQVLLASAAAVPPLEAPVSPAMFGQQSERAVGNVRQKQSFALQVFSETDRRALDEMRRGSRMVLDRLGIPIEHSTRWLPIAAVDIFEEEVERINEAARAKLEGLVGSDPRDFVESRRKAIVADLGKMAEAMGGNQVEAALVDRLVDDIARRIERALGGRIATPAGFAAITFDLEREGGVRAAWTQPARLLIELARFPREVAFKSGRLSGLSTARERILRDMDAADDVFVRTRGGYARAKDELTVIARIEQIALDDRQRAEAALMVIDGRAREVDAFLARPATSRSLKER